MGEHSPSHLTLLRPREPSYGESSRVTTDFLYNMVEMPINRNQWSSRKEFLLTSLAFCMSLPSLWRFPRDLLLYGNGSFLWLYVVFTFLIGNSLFFFEVALGQYSSKGFSKVFAMCPVFEGISYSMSLYCLIVSVFYNVLNVTYFIYFYLSFFPVFPYKNCLKTADHCVQNSTNLSSSPEYVYFRHKIINSSHIEMNVLGKVNWRNTGILFFLWMLVCVAVVRGIRTPALLYCPLPFIVLLAVLLTSFSLEGSLTGVKLMFLPTIQDFLNADTWVYALEQTIVTLGLGMGPLITFGSYSKFQSPAHKDSFLLCCCVTACCILAGMVLFSAIGILAKEGGQEILISLREYRTYLDIDTEVIYSQLFTRMPQGIDHCLAVLFFFLHWFSGWFSLISYTETANIGLYSFNNFHDKYKILVNITTCASCFIIGLLMCSSEGYKYIRSIDKCVIGTSLLIITLFELVAAVYIYGVFDLCDDIEFMLGFYPNVYYQITWICIPFILLVALIYTIYQNVNKKQSLQDLIMFGVLGICIVCPVIIKSICNCFKYYKLGIFSQVCYPREVIVTDPDDIAMYTFTPAYNRNVVSFKEDPMSPSSSE